MELHTDAARQGAAYLTKKRLSLLAIVADLIKRHPRKSEGKLFPLFRKEIAGEFAHYREDLERYFFKNAFARIMRDHEDPAAQATTKDEYTPRPAPSPERRQAIKEAVEEGVRQLQLLVLTMPNGKPMSDCTGLEMGQFGKAYERIAKRVGKNTVGEVLSESQVRELMGKAA